MPKLTDMNGSAANDVYTREGETQKVFSTLLNGWARGVFTEDLFFRVAKEFDMARPKQLEAPARDGSEVPLAITNPLVTRTQQ